MSAWGVESESPIWHTPQSLYPHPKTPWNHLPDKSSSWDSPAIWCNNIQQPIGKCWMPAREHCKCERNLLPHNPRCSLSKATPRADHKHLRILSSAKLVLFCLIFFLIKKGIFKKHFHHCCDNTGMCPPLYRTQRHIPTVSKGSRLLCRLFIVPLRHIKTKFRIITRATQGRWLGAAVHILYSSTGVPGSSLDHSTSEPASCWGTFLGKGAGHSSSPWGPATLTDWPGLRAPGPGLAQAQMLQALGGGTSKGKTPVSVSLSALKKKKNE